MAKDAFILHTEVNENLKDRENPSTIGGFLILQLYYDQTIKNFLKQYKTLYNVEPYL